jgi:hypothetical protein
VGESPVAVEAELARLRAEAGRSGGAFTARSTRTPLSALRITMPGRGTRLPDLAHG